MTGLSLAQGISRPAARWKRWPTGARSEAGRRRICGLATALPVGIAGLNSEQTPEYGMVMAAAILSCVPIVTVFFLMQRQIIAGLTHGAVKS